jgi:hypothetical protein
MLPEVTRMELNQLANLGEFIGGVAVLVTLVYLAFQVKQGTAALASNRHHEMLECAFRNATGPISQNREYADFILRAQDSPDELDKTDWYRFVNHGYIVYAMWEDALVCRQRGLIDDEYWRGWDGACRSFWTGPGYRKFWEQEREGHTPLFQDYIDSEVYPNAVD